jgi:Domain of unknown function (DUF4145)
MKCPHCLHEMFPSTVSTQVNAYGSPIMVNGSNKGHALAITATVSTCPKCHGAIIDFGFKNPMSTLYFETMRAYPRGGPFPPAPSEVPANIASDYAEANEVLPISAKASAALSRRCLQAILAAHGYTGRDLVKQIEAVLSETDSTKALPTGLRENIDAIRNFGNFSAHPITDTTTLQIVDVEEGEAEWCLQLLLDAFDHYYVAPTRAAEKRARLAAKLAAAGKPPMKQRSETPATASSLVKDGVDNGAERE